ncbi:MAG TPA: hypothetical protein VF627_02245, partial [Abditibacterium sp.]
MPHLPDDHDPFADGPLDDEAAREIETRMNIHRLKNEAKEITGAEMTMDESENAPPEVLEQFWKNIVAFERAEREPRTSMRQKLESAGISLPPSSELGDAELHTRLWQLIDWMAEQKTYLSDTDHLSDRELYDFLLEEAEESVNEFPGMNCHLSPTGSCGEDDMLIIFRFYADDAWREHWLKDWPDYPMPPRETPPYSRDHLLPQSVLPHLMFD